MKRDYGNRPRFRLSRRQALTAVASAGVGAAAVSVTSLSFATDTPDANAKEQIVVHLRDASSGTLDVFVGTSRIRIKDRDLAAKLQQAARKR